MARILYKRTEVLITEKVMGALDYETERQLNDIIGKFSHSGSTIFSCTSRH